MLNTRPLCSTQPLICVFLLPTTRTYYWSLLINVQQNVLNFLPTTSCNMYMCNMYMCNMKYCSTAGLFQLRVHMFYLLRNTSAMHVCIAQRTRLPCIKSRNIDKLVATVVALSVRHIYE